MLPVLVALVRSAQATKQSQVVCASMLHKFLFVHPCCTNSGLGRPPQETSHEMPLSSSSHSLRPDHKGNSMFCALRVHKFGPETQSRGSFPRVVCQRIPGPVPVRDCAGFAMTDHIRCLFAQCQVPFCLIGSESRVPGQPGFPHLHGMLFMIASNSVGSLAARDGFRAPELTLVWRAQWAENTWLRPMRRQLTKI